MATETVNQKTELATAPATDDYIPIWDTSAAAYKKISAANLRGGVMTGGGTIATGGFTLTVPATGSAALLATAQTFTALKTFSAGIKFANETLQNYDEGTWTPTITAATTNPTLTYTTQSGVYTRIGNLMFYDGQIVIDTLSGAGTGEWRFSLPVASARAGTVGVANLTGVDVADDTMSMYFRVAASGVTYGNIRAIRDDAATGTLTGANFASGDSISYSGFYFV